MPSKGSASEEIARIIKEHGGVLKRQNKHEFWKFPGGQTFTRSCTPSNIHAEDNALRDLKRILDLNDPERGTPGERRERRERKPSVQPQRSRPTLNGALAEKLALAGLAEQAHQEELARLHERIAAQCKQLANHDEAFRSMNARLEVRVGKAVRWRFRWLLRRLGGAA